MFISRRGSTSRPYSDHWAEKEQQRHPARRSSLSSSDQQADPVKVYKNKLVRQFYREAEVTANEPDVNKPALVYIPREVDKISKILASDLGLTAEQRTHTGKFVVVRQAGDRITGQTCEAITNDQCTADKTGDRCSTKSEYFGLSKKCGMSDKYLNKLTWNLNYYAAVYSRTNPGDDERVIPSRFPVRAILLDTASAHNLLTSLNVDTPVGRLSGPNLIDLIVARFQLGVEKGGLSYCDMLSAIYCVYLCEDLDYSRQTERAVDYLMALALDSKRAPLHTRIQFLNEQLQEPEELESNRELARVTGGSVPLSGGFGGSGLTKLAVLGILLSFAQGASGADVIDNNFPNTQVANMPFQYERLPGIVSQRIHPSGEYWSGNKTIIDEHNAVGILLDDLGGKNNPAVIDALGGRPTELLALSSVRENHQTNMAKFCEIGDTAAVCKTKLADKYAADGKYILGDVFKNMKLGDNLATCGKAMVEAGIVANVFNQDPDIAALIMFERILMTDPRKILKQSLIRFTTTTEYGQTSQPVKDLITLVINGKYKGTLSLDGILGFEDEIQISVNKIIDVAIARVKNAFEKASAADIFQRATSYLRQNKGEADAQEHFVETMRGIMRARRLSGETDETLARYHTDMMAAGVDTRETVRFMVLADMATMSIMEHLTQVSFDSALDGAIDKIFRRLRIPNSKQNEFNIYLTSRALRESSYAYLTDKSNLWMLKRFGEAYNTAAAGYVFKSVEPHLLKGVEKLGEIGWSVWEWVAAALGITTTGYGGTKTGFWLWKRVVGDKVLIGKKGEVKCVGVQCSSGAKTVQLIGYSPRADAGGRQRAYIDSDIPLEHAHINGQPLYMSPKGVVTYGKESFQASDIKNYHGSIQWPSGSQPPAKAIDNTHDDDELKETPAKPVRKASISRPRKPKPDTANEEDLYEKKKR
jgi:hypothetical protein